MYNDMAVNTQCVQVTLSSSSPYRSSVSLQSAIESLLHIDHTHCCTLNLGVRKFSCQRSNTLLYLLSISHSYSMENIKSSPQLSVTNITGKKFNKQISCKPPPSWFVTCSLHSLSPKLSEEWPLNCDKSKCTGQPVEWKCLWIPLLGLLVPKVRSQDWDVNHSNNSLSSQVGYF
jgi:hypothetical protein